jgi:hypothetical protein
MRAQSREKDRARFAVCALLSLLSLSLALSACGGEESGGMDGLEPYLPEGQSGPWLGEKAGEVYRMSNTADPGVIQYYFVAPAPGSEGRRKISVKVAIEAAGQGTRAGLIYGRIDNASPYYFFMLEPDGRAVLWHRDAKGGLSEMMSAQEERDTQGFITLALEEKGDELVLRVDGKRVGSLSREGLGRGAAGIAAGGTGRFAFTAFVHEPAPLSAEVPAAGGPAEDQGKGARPVFGRKKLDGTVTPELVHLKRFDIVDAQGFGEPVVALTLLAPADWRLEGGVAWNMRFQCMGDMVRVSARLTSPDGKLGFEIFPSYIAEWQDDEWGRNMQAELLAQGQPGCPLQPPFGAEDFLARMLVPGFRQGAAIAAREPAPQVARAYEAKIRALLGQLDPSIKIRTDAGRALVRRQGFEEWITAITTSTAMPGLSPTAAMQGGMAYQYTYYTLAESVFGFRAPEGTIAQYEPLMAAMMGSVRINPQWEAAIQRVQQNIQRTILQGIADRAAIMRQAQSEIADIQMQAWRGAQAAQDRVMTNWSQQIRGTATYIDPEGQMQTELPDHYDSVWSNGLGDYVLVTTPGLNPNQVLDGNWTEWQKAR